MRLQGRGEARALLNTQSHRTNVCQQMIPFLVSHGQIGVSLCGQAILQARQMRVQLHTFRL